MRAIKKVSCRDIATAAQDVAHFTAVVIVIDARPIHFLPLWLQPLVAASTLSTLLEKPLCVLTDCNSVFAGKVVLARIFSRTRTAAIIQTGFLAPVLIELSGRFPLITTAALVAAFGIWFLS